MKKAIIELNEKGTNIKPYFECLFGIASKMSLELIQVELNPEQYSNLTKFRKENNRMQEIDTQEIEGRENKGEETVVVISALIKTSSASSVKKFCFVLKDAKKPVQAGYCSHVKFE